MKCCHSPIIVLLALTLMASSCNQSPDRRTPLQTNNVGFPFNFNGYPPPSRDQDDGDQDKDDNTGQGGAAPPPGFSHCQFDGRPYRVHENQLGTIDLCQDLSKKSSFILRSSLTHNVNKICIYPTSRNEDNWSIFIGAPHCQHLEAERFIALTLIKFPEAQHHPINGAMVLFENIVASYLNCIATPSGYHKNILCNTFYNKGGFIDFNFNFNTNQDQNSGQTLNI